MFLIVLLKHSIDRTEIYIRKVGRQRIDSAESQQETNSTTTTWVLELFQKNSFIVGYCNIHMQVSERGVVIRLSALARLTVVHSTFCIGLLSSNTAMFVTKEFASDV